MADAATATGRLLNKAQNAGKPAPSDFDVWNRTFDGERERMKNFDPDAPPAPVQAMEDLGKAMTRDRHAATPAGVAKGMAQQTNALKKQLGQLLHVGDGPAPQGFLGHVGAAFGVLSTVEQIVSMPLSMIPAPALPAVRILDYDIGLPHGHPHPPNTPPAPPMMLPSTGPVIPIPVVSGAGTVLINGMPAARCGDMGLGIWCGGYFPFYEIFLGSSNVWLEGARAARLATDITTHCIMTNPKPAKPTDAPIGPMTGFTITASSNVAIGGVPMPSLSAKVMGAAFKALFKTLGKLVGRLKGLLGKKVAGYLPKVRGPARVWAAFRGGNGLRVGRFNFMTPAAFRRSIDLIRDLKNAGKIVISGSDDFVKAAERDLHVLGSSNTGRRVLEEIKASGQKVFIEEGGPNCRALSDGGADFDFAHPDGARPGPGSGSKVKYKPDEWYGPETPPDAVLLHELGHARNNAKGEKMQHAKFDDPGDAHRWSDMEEHQTIENIENPYRRERGLPERTGHDDSP